MAGQNIIAEYDGPTLLRRYVHGSGVDEPIAEIDYSPTSGTYYYHADHVGTVVARTNSTGNIEANDNYSYSPYGEPKATEGAIWRFTGRQLDAETGLYYYRARMYSAEHGRFLQVDPVGDRDSPNLYQYAMRDPITNKDPNGAQAVPAAMGALAVVGGLMAVDCYRSGACNRAGDYAKQKVDELKTWMSNKGKTPDSTKAGDEKANDPEGTVATDSAGKVHGPLPDISDVDDDHLEDADKALGDSIKTRSRENEKFPKGNPNGSDDDKRDFQRSKQHQERISEGPKLREQIRQRIKRRDEH